ncbi:MULTISPECIES: GNAT family N-acetyltransferase [Macrococcus]|uniref:GNAT family N-acetyltransferase n=1 Tax=Macrococcus psychrotolerans TaxID=3039389 RepID=A0AAT9P540_9STAP|nr:MULTISPECIES: GNAT family N-acetyltransferase [Macrococcus]MDJ1111603.1 GNAT family N-acetyltransferase [Macrococcus sp. S115]QYA32336.1 GNAT family N-acetyltransferase [Macrococcus sp. 19Msa1099]QYA37143.1 GNAT family N-acetyltransferase [Macrococcus caseolyticus]QYA75851.1 GNAT family N-acetyltransferase [Macrococcus caseolyticus]
MFEIRSVNINDAEGILEYCKIVGGETDNLLFGSEGLGFSVETERTIIANIAAKEKDIMLVAMDEDNVVGIGNIMGNGRMRIEHQARLAISVRKDYWGQGVGSRIMQSLIDFAKERSIEVITLEVYHANESAINLYQKFGFKEIGYFKNYSKVNDEYKDAVLMNLYL